MNQSAPQEGPMRRKPAEGVLINFNQPIIVFVTACTKDRARWLACEEAHRLLKDTWRQATAWLAGNYVVMPDHLHLFAAPRDLSFTIERWIAFWKSRFSKAHDHDDWNWQANAFHHRLRRELLAEMALRAGESGAGGIGEGNRTMALPRNDT